KRSQSAAQRTVYHPPILSSRTMDTAGVEGWPVAGATVVCIGPFENERDRERRMKPPVTMPDATLFPKQLSERTAARKSAIAMTQGYIDGRPSNSQRTRDAATVAMRPLAGAFVPRIGPGEDLPYRKIR